MTGRRRRNRTATATARGSGRRLGGGGRRDDGDVVVYRRRQRYLLLLHPQASSKFPHLHISRDGPSFPPPPPPPAAAAQSSRCGCWWRPLQRLSSSVEPRRGLASRAVLPTSSSSSFSTVQYLPLLLSFFSIFFVLLLDKYKQTTVHTHLQYDHREVVVVFGVLSYSGFRLNGSLLPVEGARFVVIVRYSTVPGRGSNFSNFPTFQQWSFWSSVLYQVASPSNRMNSHISWCCLCVCVCVCVLRGSLELLHN